MSYVNSYYQIVFRTKFSAKSLNQEHSKELYSYIHGILKNKRCKLYRINGIDDHIHIFTHLHPSVALADLVKDIKVSSSKWMKASGNFPLFQGWGIKYFAATYSIREKDMIIDYVKNQQEHHKFQDFQVEIMELMRENGQSDPENRFWDET